jgi:2-(1,2-epoxy-1,2-dihydrophenyl)acetyl-CoA isomerase
VSAPLILLDIAEAVATVTLNRSDKLNAFNEAMHGELARALDRIEGDEAVRAVLLTGAGRGFCAGQDLGDRAMGEDQESIDLGDTLERLYNPLIRRIAKLECPVVCAVNGVAAGAGANLALVCDIVIAGRSAAFIQAFCRIGLVPDSGGTWFLPLPAEQAEAWGLIWRCVDDAQLMKEARALASHLATQPTRGLGLIKRALNASPENDLDAQLDLERDLQREAGRTEDYREGTRAFLEKRRPAFKGC